MVAVKAGLNEFFRVGADVVPVFVLGVFESNFLVFDVVINFLWVSGLERRTSREELVRDDA